ncbi:hypothetical protein HO133_003099 [Letharia lupina]|uniref:Regulator of phospholipase D SRF1 n=1 Tax=Letharia lupina TaxID=560253 RepID=A0A8H6CCB5_9LECA|nr:uncharacterized protein HO133_003099 [Letharia lupina]KAF6220666.1 hypothetical protein HO133_003099 [Letharia lupina]
MVFGESSFRSRAASLLRPSTPSKTQSLGQGANQEKGSGIASNTPTESPLNEKPKAEEGQNGLEKSQTLSSNGKTFFSSGDNAVVNDEAAQRIVRTIPSWVHTLDEEDEDLLATAPSLPHTPAGALIAQETSTTIAAHNQQPGPSRGRLYDHERKWTPPLARDAVRESGSRWRAFASSSAYPTISAEGGEIVTEEWLQQNGPDYSRPWLAGASDGDPEKDPAGLYRFRAKRRAWYVRAQRTVLRNPIVPMIIRMNVWLFSAVALALACSIHHITDKNPRDISATPSTNMAIVVDAVALVYLLYITYDEYSGKPLGLRPAKAKMRLIFLDLFFIVFDSANLSLAFEAIKGNCESQVCSRQKALASVLLIALIAWLLTFSISVMRLVERVTTR